MIGLIMFVVAFATLFMGYPIAFTFTGVSLRFIVINYFYVKGADAFAVASVGDFFSSVFDLFAFMPYRIYSIMENVILMAIPLFIFMGIVLQKTKLAERLLESTGVLFGNIRGSCCFDYIGWCTFSCIYRSSWGDSCFDGSHRPSCHAAIQVR